jgi:hypothetical protein
MMEETNAAFTNTTFDATVAPNAKIDAVALVAQQKKIEEAFISSSGVKLMDMKFDAKLNDVEKAQSILSTTLTASTDRLSKELSRLGAMSKVDLNGATFIVREEADIKKISREIAVKMRESERF